MRANGNFATAGAGINFPATNAVKNREVAAVVVQQAFAAVVVAPNE